MCVKHSYLWKYFTQYKLTKNMRVRGDGKFKQWRDTLMKIGNGSIDIDQNGHIILPSHVLDNESTTSIEMQNKAIEFVYQDMNENIDYEMYFLNRCILCPHNDSVKEINEQVTDLFHGEEIISYSSDSMIDNEEDIPVEFLNTLNISGLPQHELILKKNMPVMLMRNIDKERGLCNGTRVIVKSFRGSVLHIYNPTTREDVCLPRFIWKQILKNVEFNGNVDNSRSNKHLQ